MTSVHNKSIKSFDLYCMYFFVCRCLHLVLLTQMWKYGIPEQPQVRHAWSLATPTALMWMWYLGTNKILFSFLGETMGWSRSGILGKSKGNDTNGCVCVLYSLGGIFHECKITHIEVKQLLSSSTTQALWRLWSGIRQIPLCLHHPGKIIRSVLCIIHTYYTYCYIYRILHLCHAVFHYHIMKLCGNENFDVNKYHMYSYLQCEVCRMQQNRNAWEGINGQS